MNRIITIGREHGSGGREIGVKLSEKLGCPLFDKEIINEAAKKSRINQELFEKYDERALSSSLYAMVIGISADPAAQPLSIRIQKAYAETIHEFAKEPCIIVGRSADYLLRDCKNLITFFITADRNARISRIAARYGISEEEADKMILKQDKARAGYYRSMTGNTWGMASNYDFCLNSSRFGIDKTVEIVEKIVR